jgi:hypothetical protein
MLRSIRKPTKKPNEEILEITLKDVEEEIRCGYMYGSRDNKGNVVLYLPDYRSSTGVINIVYIGKKSDGGLSIESVGELLKNDYKDKILKKIGSYRDIGLL